MDYVASSRSLVRRLAALAACAALAALAWAAKREFVMPAAASAQRYPAHDEHTSEKVTVAADPYDTSEKEEIFAGSYRERGLLPVLLVVTNDGDQPISLAAMKVEVLTRNKVKVPPATQDDIFRRMQGTVKRPDAPRPYPLPLPRRKMKSPLSSEIREEIDAATFQARAVEAHGTQRGFVFFDFKGLDNPLAGAQLFVSGVRTGDGQELWFFEIPMEKYLLASPGRNP